MMRHVPFHPDRMTCAPYLEELLVLLEQCQTRLR